METLFGLIGYPLTHSFSKKYFTEKFERENISGHRYELFEMQDPSELLKVIAKHPELKGVNVTIPHKEKVMTLLDSIDPAAEKIGAVNVIRINDGKLRGYNSDYYGFKLSLEKILDGDLPEAALILGTGGASKAVKAALEELKIPFQEVSSSGKTKFSYSDLSPEVIRANRLIINSTPLGMYPKVDTCPELPYEAIGKKHYLYDLVYNPAETLFMKKGKERGAKTANGLEMLHLQAEKAWEIWNS